MKDLPVYFSRIVQIRPENLAWGQITQPSKLRKAYLPGTKKKTGKGGRFFSELII